MGMYGYLRQLTPSELQWFQEKPGTLVPFLAREFNAEPAGESDFVSVDAQPVLELDKIWDVLHYLLNGTKPPVPPLGDAIQGGEEIGDDMGYGPARFLAPEKVRAVAAALGKLSWDTLASRYNPEEARNHEVYIAGSKGVLEEARGAFGRLVRFYSDAASRDNAVLLYIV